ncbi:MAG: Xaa-Pro dipeptidase [Chloroflexota bacterium]|jgi:Xaa-Pro aminopeptidase|nr:Xaa-Pro dipeptidase [Chloroflexota bacterium]
MTQLRELGQQEYPGKSEDLSYPYPRFSLAERDRRWAAVRAEMAKAGVDVLVGSNNTGHWDHWQSDIRYLTQIGGHSVDAAVVFPIAGEPTGFAINDLYWGIASPYWLRDLRPTGWRWGEAIGKRLQELAAEMGKDDLTIAITGLEGVLRAPEGTVPWATVEKIKELMPRAKLVNGTDICRYPRYVKSQEEIDILQHSVDLIEQMVEAMRTTARPGVKESVVYANMIQALIAGGGEIPTMLSWLSGPWGKLSRRLTIATERVMQVGDAIANEIEGRYAGYTGQQDQPLFVGPLPAGVEDMFKWQLDAVDAAMEVMSPGHVFQEVIDAARDASKGSEKYVTGLTIHGRGLGDDWPLVTGGNVAGGTGNLGANPIEENTVFVVKPSVRPRDSHYRGEGLTWADTVRVTATGAQRMGKRERGLISVQ